MYRVEYWVCRGGAVSSGIPLAEDLWLEVSLEVEP